MGGSSVPVYPVVNATNILSKFYSWIGGTPPDSLWSSDEPTRVQAMKSYQSLLIKNGFCFVIKNGDTVKWCGTNRKLLTSFMTELSGGKLFNPTNLSVLTDKFDPEDPENSEIKKIALLSSDGSVTKTLTTDSVFKSLFKKQGVGFSEYINSIQSPTIKEFYNGKVQWNSVKDWDGIEDDKLLSAMRADTLISEFTSNPKAVLRSANVVIQILAKRNLTRNLGWDAEQIKKAVQEAPELAELVSKYLPKTQQRPIYTPTTRTKQNIPEGVPKPKYSISKGAIIQSDVYRSEGNVTITGNPVWSGDQKEWVYPAITNGGRTFGVAERFISKIVTPAQTESLVEASFRDLLNDTVSNGRYKIGGLRRVGRLWIYDRAIPDRVSNSRFVVTRRPVLQLDNDGFPIYRFQFRSRPDRNTTNMSHQGYVKFVERPKFLARVRYFFKEEIDLQVHVHCTCPDFKYRWHWILAKANCSHKPTGLGFDAIDKRPDRTNPNGMISMCKHLVVAKDYLLLSANEHYKIVKNIQKASPLRAGTVNKPDSREVKPGADVKDSDD
jgi:hypothetical protein